MEQSESIIELAKALSKFQGAVKSVKRDSTNPYFHSKYASLDAVWETARKPLADNGLSLVQLIDDIDGSLFLYTTLFHVSGEFIRSRYPITPMRQTKDQGWVLSDDPQSMGAAIKYARRYSMSAMIGLSDDDDGDGGNQASTPRQQTQRPPVAPARGPAGQTQGPDTRTITEAQRNRMFAIARTQGVTEAAIREWMAAFAEGKEHTKELKRSEYDKLVQWIETGGTLPEQELFAGEEE